MTDGGDEDDNEDGDNSCYVAQTGRELIVLLMLVWKSQSSCLSHPSAWMTEMNHREMFLIDWIMNDITGKHREEPRNVTSLGDHLGFQ